MTAATHGNVVLRAVDVVKTYGATTALKGVDFDVRRGCVTVLFGENGAGKSTLMKILSGVEQPSGGHIEIDGTITELASTTAARAAGIGIIHQELNLCPNLSVRDNVFLGYELRTARSSVDYAREDELTRRLMERLEEPIDPGTLVADLRLGQQQIVEIARALAADARILIMDEPTSALSAMEVDVLFRVVRELTAAGVAVVYISHHLEESLAIADHAVVLRDGQLVASARAEDIDLRWVVRTMVGHTSAQEHTRPQRQFGEVRLAIEHLTVADPDGSGRLAVDDVSLEIRSGEITCLYGLMGAGRTELMEALAGREPIASGTVLLDDVNVTSASIVDRIDGGLGLVPEDRQRDGLLPLLSVGQNLSLSSLRSMVRGLFVSSRNERSLVEDQIGSVKVKTAGPQAPITSLSGGNQQKVVIGRVLMTGPRVLLLDEPTRGIDVGAKAEIFGLLTREAGRGLAVLFVTSEIGEALSAAHRIVVMAKGRIVREFDPRRTTREEVMAASGEAAPVSAAAGGEQR